MSKYRILSFDGGGIRGLLSAVILEQLDKRVSGWRDKVNLIAGTSTGGIIALGLAKGLSPLKLRQLYYDKSPKIFKDSFFDDLRDLGSWIGAEYGNRNLRKELRKIFGDTLLRDLKKRVLVPSFDLDNEDEDKTKRCWKPKFFHNFPGRDSDGGESVVKVAMYTSAAPTYFPSVDGYIDGGVIANNPAIAALTQVLDKRARIRSRPSIDEIVLLSVGTGRALSKIKGKRHNWGKAQWVQPLISLMLEGSMGVVDYQCKRLLGNSYCKVNFTFPPKEEIGLDDYKKRDRLVEIGETQMVGELDKTAEWLEKNWI